MIGERRCYRDRGSGVVIPGCWGSALHTANDFKGCTCPRTPPKDLAQKLSELERRVKVLEGKLKPRGATDADE